jgi:hypothetical protein
MDALRPKETFICDMDGVIYHGNQLLPGVTKFLDWLRKEHKKFRFHSGAGSCVRRYCHGGRRPSANCGIGGKSPPERRWIRNPTNCPRCIRRSWNSSRRRCRLCNRHHNTRTCSRGTFDCVSIVEGRHIFAPQILPKVGFPWRMPSLSYFSSHYIPAGPGYHLVKLDTLLQTRSV